MASIGPYKWGLGLQQEIYVPTRRGKGTHLQPKNRTCGSVGLRNAPVGAAPYGYFVGWQHVIKCSVGYGLDRSECLVHMPFGKNILLGLGTDIFWVCGKEPPLRPLRVQRKQRPVPSVALRHLPVSRGVTP